MTESKYEFGKYKNDALTMPRDKAWDNWAKFEKVGDKVQGFIRDVFYRQSEGDFKEQRALTLEQEDGVMINVGIKHIDFILKRTNNLRLGDPITIVFEKEIKATTKGHSPTKQFAFYGSNLSENAKEKTVLQLENEDRKLNSEADAEASKEFNAIGTPEGGPAPETPADASPAPETPDQAALPKE